MTFYNKLHFNENTINFRYVEIGGFSEVLTVEREIFQEVMIGTRVNTKDSSSKTTVNGLTMSLTAAVNSTNVLPTSSLR